MTEMTKPFLKKLCKEHSLYTTPSINDKLYLHYKGFNSIANLEEYTGLKALWLEGNGLPRIEGLEEQKLLRSLYLHENLIEKIENLESQTDLDCLNLSKNYIKKIENLSHMTKLTTLNLAHNHISTREGVEHVLQVPSIQTIDLQHNKIEDPSVVDVFAALPDLRVLYLMGNPAVKSIPNYRKTVVSRCKELRYLDDRPVFEEERRRVNAWAAVLDSGGSMDAAMEAERNELSLIRKEKDEADMRNFKAFEQMMQEGQAIRRAREEAERAAVAAAGGAVVAPAAVLVSDENNGGNANFVVTSEVNPYSGENVIKVPEHPDLTAFRESRWKGDSNSGAEREEPRVVELTDEAEEPVKEKGVGEEAPLKWSKLKIEEEEEEESTPEEETEQQTAAPTAPSAVAAVNEKKSKFMSLLDTASAEVQAGAVSTSKTTAATVDLESLD